MQKSHKHQLFSRVVRFFLCWYHFRNQCIYQLVPFFDSDSKKPKKIVIVEVEVEHDGVKDHEAAKKVVTYGDVTGEPAGDVDAVEAHAKKVDLTGESAGAAVKHATVKLKLCFNPVPLVNPQHTAAVIHKVTATVKFLLVSSKLIVSNLKCCMPL